jgi:hypothetical protein
VIKIGIIINSWKLPIFKRHLEKAGFKFKTSPRPGDTLALTLMAHTVSELETVVRAAEAECKK